MHGILLIFFTQVVVVWQSYKLYYNMYLFTVDSDAIKSIHAESDIYSLADKSNSYDIVAYNVSLHNTEKFVYIICAGGHK